MSAKNPKRSKLDLEDVRRLVECPVCFEIPRDGILIMCQNGHNVCNVCRNKLRGGPTAAKCPQGGCKYDAPPRRNRTAADLIDTASFSFACKYSKATDGSAGCDFEATLAQLEAHESACPHRTVPCPNPDCDAIVSAKRIVKHWQRDHHHTIYPLDEDKPFTIKSKLFLRKSNFFRNVNEMHYTPHGCMYTVVQRGTGDVHIWLVGLGIGEHEARRLKYKVCMGNADHSMTFTAPVYPVDWTRKRIIEDARCLRLTTWAVNQMLDEDIPEEQKILGYRGKVNILFDIEEKFSGITN